MELSRDGGARLTAHGEFRLLKRLGIPIRSLERMAKNAYVRGKRPEDFEGSFRNYLEHIRRKTKPEHGHKVDVVVYGENIFIFAGRNLITAWPRTWAHEQET